MNKNPGPCGGGSSGGNNPGDRNSSVNQTFDSLVSLAMKSLCDALQALIDFLARARDVLVYVLRVVADMILQRASRLGDSGS